VDILTRNDASGQCGAWAELFRDMCRVHGIATVHKVHVEVPPVENPRIYGFLVKHWTFNAPPAPEPADLSHYLRRLGDGGCVRNPPMLAGQGNADPPDVFLNHYITYNTATATFYDPSYGASAANRAAWEGASIDGRYTTPDPMLMFPDAGYSTAAGGHDLVTFTDLETNNVL
jgi:hypothetical protein